MLDINLLRNDIEAVAARLAGRGYTLDTAAFNQLESERKSLQSRMQELQAKRNASSKQIGIAKSKGEDVSAIMAEVATLGDELKAAELAFEGVQSKLDAWLMSIPNLPHESVPVGKDEADNVEVRRVGVPRQFDFAVKDHVDVGIPLGLDAETGAKLSGARFTVLKGDIARLHRAIAQFMLNTHTGNHGYVEHYTPYIVNDTALFGTGQLPKFAEDMFKVMRGGDETASPQYLISTSEITLTNTVADTMATKPPARNT
ncbi:serine--tRNA ligase, partial (plasmid) [Chromobacterium amazonense]|nr:serine--tRNA ligase [Chromobacterium amazonense]